METIAILKALLKWEDKLIGNKIHVVTDHHALEFFKMQRRLSNCQMSWMEYLTWFDFDIQYLKGVGNKVADSLSWYYQSDTWEDIHPSYYYVNADSQLDLEGKDLPWNHIVEIWAIGVSTHQWLLREGTEEWDTLAEN